jgi:hypothetical protein
MRKNLRISAENDISFYFAIPLKRLRLECATVGDSRRSEKKKPTQAMAA